MIGMAPEFTDSKYFVAKPEWHLTEGATDKEKAELEKYMNDSGLKDLWKARNPSMKNPYYTWDGRVIDKK